MVMASISKIQTVLIVALIAANIGSVYWFQSRIDVLQTEIGGLQTEIDVLRQEDVLRETVQASRLWRVADAIRITIEGDIQSLITTGQIVAALPEVRSGVWRDMKDTLTLYGSQLVAGSFMWFCYPNGTYYTTLQGYINKSLSDRPYFPVVMGGNVSIGTTVYSRSMGVAVHVTGIPVVNGTSVVGILGISTPLSEWTTSVASQLGIVSPNLFFVHSLDGQTQMHQQTKMIFDTNPITGEGMNETISYTSLKNLIEDAFVKKEGTGTYEYAGVVRACGYTMMTDLSWTVFYSEEIPVGFR